MGIHPSFKSAHYPSLVALEKERLVQICGHTISRSRQHFLRLQFPSTYRALLKAGIEEDFSMGYADAIGFRAWTSVPFRWFDLKREEITPLLITPFQVMDVSLQQYLGLTPEQAKEHLSQLIKTVRNTGGQFCTLWHNSSFDEEDDWKGWTSVYQHILKECEMHREE